MAAIVFLIVGLAIGAFARFLIPAHARGGWGLALSSGVLGALLGGYCGLSLGMYHVAPRPTGIIMSVVFALALALSYEAFRRNRVA